MTDEKPEVTPEKEASTPAKSDNSRELRPRSFSKYIYIVFFWCMVGVSVIYGVRLWHDAPPHPSFVPIIGGVFSAILAFTLVIALEYVIGPIKITIGDKFGFTGASGPIVLWCICFLVIAFGLYLLGIGDILTKDLGESHVACSLGDLMFGECSNRAATPEPPDS